MPEDQKTLEAISELREELAQTRRAHEALVEQLEGSQPRSYSEAAAAARQRLRDGYTETEAAHESTGESDDE